MFWQGGCRGTKLLSRPESRKTEGGKIRRRENEEGESELLRGKTQTPGICPKDPFPSVRYHLLMSHHFQQSIGLWIYQWIDSSMRVSTPRIQFPSTAPTPEHCCTGDQAFNARALGEICYLAHNTAQECKVGSTLGTLNDMTQRISRLNRRARRASQ